jgi:hypothetical protein
VINRLGIARDRRAIGGTDKHKETGQKQRKTKQAWRAHLQ